MSVLGNIAHRLKTDIGENLRAQIDVDYSRQLTQDRFNRQAQSEKDRRDEQIRINDRREKIEDEALKQKTALQLKAGDQLFQTGKDTGNWGGFLGYVDNPNLIPDVRDYVVALSGADGTRSLDSIRLDHQMKVDFDKKTQAEKRATLDRDKYETDKQKGEAEIQLKREKYRFEKMQDLRETNQSRNNRSDMIAFIEQTPDIETEKERTAFLTRLKTADSSPDAVNKVWDEIMARLSDRLAEREKNHRAKLAVSGANGNMTTDPSKTEKELARQGLIERLGDQFLDLPDDEDDNQQQAFINSVASKLNELSRGKDGKDQSQFVQQAIDETLAGFDKGEGKGFLGFFDKESFSLSREDFIRNLNEEEIQSTMEINNMSRDQVVNALLLKHGYD